MQPRANRSSYTVNWGRHFTLIRANLTLVNVTLTGGNWVEAGAAGVNAQNSVAQGGGAVYADSASWLVASYSTFAQNSAIPTSTSNPSTMLGGAISSFNTDASAVILANCNLRNNSLGPAGLKVSAIGGAIFAMGGVTLTNCVVSNHNLAQPLGLAATAAGIYAPAITATNSVFSNNLNNGFGGAIVTGIVTTNTSCAAFNYTCTITLSGCTFTGNRANSGGAVGVVNQVSSSLGAGNDGSYSTVFTDTGSTYTGNVAAGGGLGAGGALFLWTANVSISGSIFTANTAVSGGAIYVAPQSATVSKAHPLYQDGGQDGTAGNSGFLNSIVVVSNCTFIGNKVIFLPGRMSSAQLPLSNGGALNIGGLYKASVGGPQPKLWSTLTIMNSSFANNTAGLNGGAVYLYNVGVTLTGMTCTGSVAQQGYGGCVAVSPPNDLAILQLPSFSLSNSVFANNSAVYGGAVSIACQQQLYYQAIYSYPALGGAACNVTQTISNTVMRGNSVSGQGGALHLLAGGSVQITAGSVLSGNSAAGSSAAGGAIYLADYLNPFTSPALLVDNSTLSSNVVSLAAGSLLPGQNQLATFGAGQGGAVSMTATGTPYQALVTLSGASTISGNTAISGGGLFLFGSLVLNATAVSFTSNSASDKGGALLLQAPMTAGTAVYINASLRASSFVANSAVTGAVATINNGVAVVSSSAVYRQNLASLGGAVFYMQAASNATTSVPTVALYNVTAVGNAALAGGLAFTNATTAIAAPTYDTATVLNNTASSHGALIASAPVNFTFTGPQLARSGNPLQWSVQLQDVYGQVAQTWPSVVATLTPSSPSAVAGPTSVLYTRGSASFSGSTLSGLVNTSFTLNASVASPALSAAVQAQVASGTVTISPCRQNEVFQTNALLCVCIAGTYLNSATGLCTLCSPGFYSTVNSASCTVCATGSVSGAGATACTSCPSNSLSVNNVCACSVGYYDTLWGVNTSAPVCAACPLGGDCSTGTVGAMEGFWRLNQNSDIFLPCKEGFCLAENVTGPLSVTSSASNSSNSTITAGRRRGLFQVNLTLDAAGWAATNCVSGSTGPICGLCLPGYTLQSGQCLPCDPKAAFTAWSPRLKGLLYAGAVVIAIFVVALAFLQPISPLLERIVAGATSFASNTAQGAKACITCACCRKPKVEEKGKSGGVETAREHEKGSEAVAGASGAEHSAQVQVIESTGPAAPAKSAALYRVKQDADLDAARKQAADFEQNANRAFAAGLMMGAMVEEDGDDVEDDVEEEGEEGVDAVLMLMDKIQRQLDKLAKVGKIMVKYAPCPTCCALSPQRTDQVPHSFSPAASTKLCPHSLPH